MKDLMGSPGSVSGLLLRILQCMFAAGSIGVMVSAHGFSNFTAYCYLIASMGLQVLWSFGLACLDAYALWIKKDLRNPVLASLFVVGDWGIVEVLSLAFLSTVQFYIGLRQIGFMPTILGVTATLALAAACSSAGIAVLYGKDLKFCRGPVHLPCDRFELSIALAFVTWFLVAMSSHVTFWILASI